MCQRGGVLPQYVPEGSRGWGWAAATSRAAGRVMGGVVLMAGEGDVEGAGEAWTSHAVADAAFSADAAPAARDCMTLLLGLLAASIASRSANSWRSSNVHEELHDMVHGPEEAGALV